MRRLQPATLIALFAALLAIRAHPAPPQEQQQTRTEPTRLTLEVIYYQCRPPAYQSIPAPDAKAGGAWYGLFRRVPSWRPRPGSLPVWAVNILSRTEGDSVRVAVSAFLGVRLHEKEEPVATYLVREGEKISVSELTQFGVEPFEIKVVRVPPTVLGPPPVVSGAESVAVVNATANDATLPSYKLSLRNFSGKGLVALGVELHVSGWRRLSSIPKGEEGRFLIPAGDVGEINVLGGYNAQQITPEGYAPVAAPDQKILITAAVFEDGSYEGDVGTASVFRAFTAGHKIQIARLIPLIQDALESGGTELAAETSRLKARVSSLSTDVETHTVDELIRSLPALDQKASEGLRTAIEVALNGIKTDFLKKLEEFEKNGLQPPDADAFRAWLKANKERYEKWLSRL